MYDKQKMIDATRLFLEAIGEDPEREGLKETPERVAKMYGILLDGYNQNAKDHLKVFTEKTRNMVIVKDIPLYSFCEHHIVLMAGKVSIAYVPDGKVLGLSKLVRVARVYAKRLQLQERLTDQIAEALDEALLPKGVAVTVEMEHFCMSIRGVRTPGAKTVTTRLTGVFLQKPEVREEFFNSLK